MCNSKASETRDNARSNHSMSLIGFELLGAYQAPGVVQFQRNTGSFFTIQNDMYVFSFYIWETLDEAFGDEAAWA